jgi:adenylate kinase family enzyme
MEEFHSFTDLLNGDDLTEHIQEFGTEPNDGQQPNDVQQTPIVKSTPSSKASQKTKGKNFSVEEDRLLASSWLNVSTDPKQRTNQTKATFWTRVYTYYQNHRETLVERSENSLLHPWGLFKRL